MYLAHQKARFFIDPLITDFARDIIINFGLPTEQALLLPSHATAARCISFFKSQLPTLEEGGDLITVVLTPKTDDRETETSSEKRGPSVVAVLFPRTYFSTAKAFWQHTGEGISSRRAEVFHKAFKRGHLLVDRQSRVSGSPQTTHLLNPQLAPPSKLHKPALTTSSKIGKGPQRYRKRSVNDGSQAVLGAEPVSNLPREPNGTDGKDHVLFLEERFGRNLNSKLADSAKFAVRRRIAGALIADSDLHDALEKSEVTGHERGVSGFSVDDVYLYPSGMSSIFNTHQTLMKCRGALRSICFGFPYIDTLKILEKWGPGCVFYGHGSAADIDDLEERCKKGERFLALFCEFPGNPLLQSPDIRRLRSLADEYDFAIIIDETIGNFLNVNVLPFADIIVSSLTKVFSGDSNVMGGSSVLNPKRRFYKAIKLMLEEDYEDNYWLEDAIFMERNSRDFVSRIGRINMNAEAICDVLKASSIVKEVYYPKYSPTRQFYDQCRTTSGGYGGLLSITFWSTSDAINFFDALATAKGPSLGTNFTLSCPFVLLAHYGELEWAAQFGAEADLVRVSVGLEDTSDLIAIFRRALIAATPSEFTIG